MRGNGGVSATRGTAVECRACVISIKPFSAVSLGCTGSLGYCRGKCIHMAPYVIMYLATESHVVLRRAGAVEVEVYSVHVWKSRE